MYDIVFFYSSINRGGSELALLRYLKNTNKLKEYNAILVYFKDTSDIKMIDEFKKVIEVKKLNDGENIKTKTAVNCMISTTENGFFNKILANKYILWVQVNPKVYSNYKDFYKYDSFLTTSNFIKGMVLEYTGIENKTIYLANPIVDTKEVLEKSKEYQDILNDNDTNIITIARVTHEKGYDYIIELAKRLKQRNIKFKWYMLGFISEKEKEYYSSIMKIIEENNLKDNIIFMGAHENPYKYLKHAYLNVLLSKGEAWGLAVTEAKILRIPSIASNNTALKEQIEDGINGYLVDLPEKDSDYEIITDKIQKLIEDKNIYNNMVNNLQNYEINLNNIIRETDKCFFE